MAFIQKINGKKGPIYKVHFKEQSTGKRRCKSFKRRKDAEAFRDGPKIQNKQKPTGKTLTEVAERWLDICATVGRKGREPISLATRKSYTNQMQVIIEATITIDGASLALGDCLVDHLDRPVCETFRDHLTAHYSRDYAKRVFFIFKGILEQACIDGILTTSPASDLYIRMSARDPAAALTATDKAPSIQEIKTILTTLRTRLEVKHKRTRRERWRYKLIIETLIFGGTRPGEALGLPWSKVDFHKGGIHIVQDVEFDGTIGLPKSSAAYRFIPMPVPYIQELLEWREYCPASKLDLVFPNWKGNPEFVSNLNHRGWRPVLSEAGIVTADGKPKYPPKSLRHARASLEIESGANPKEIQKLMGHSSIKITYDVYGHLFDAHAERRATRANAIAHMLTGDNTD